MLEYARILTKSSEGLPTIPPSATHDNGDWSPNDIYEFELYVDSSTGYLYTRVLDNIVLLTERNYLSTVNHGDSLIGDGTPENPLDVNVIEGEGNLLLSTLGGLYVGPDGSKYDASNPAGYLDSAGVADVIASTGIDVGNTVIQNGTDGRVLFQKAGKVGQSSNFFWNDASSFLGIGQTSPSARLDILAQGALSTDLALRVRNSANTANLFSVNGTGGFESTYFWSFKRLNGTTLELYSLTTGFSFREGGTPFALLGLNESKFGNTNTNDSVLGIRTSTAYGGEYPLGSILQGQGTNGSVVLSPSNGVANKAMLGYYNGSSWVSALEYNNTASGGTVVKLLQNGSGAVSIGQATNGARLDIRAQGALSTDLAFRIRNSANTQDWISVQGDGVVNVSNTLSSYKFFCQNFRLEADGATRINGGFLQLANNTYVNSYNQDLLLNCYSTGASRTNNVIIDHNSASNTGIQGDIKLLQFKYRGSTAQAVIFGDGGTVFGNQTKVASAKVQIDSTTQGFLPPRMTNAERTAIASPAIGLMVYCTDMVEGLYVYKSTGWTFVI